MRLVFVFLIPAVVWPAILPDTIRHWKRGEPAAAPAPDPKVWEEYGLRDGETSPYSDAGQKFFDFRLEI